MLAASSAAKPAASVRMRAKGISAPRAGGIRAGGTAEGPGSKSLSPAGSIVVQTGTKIDVILNILKTPAPRS